jgi:hypothetical protein
MHSGWQQCADNRGDALHRPLQGKRCARSGPAQADGVASFVWLDSSKAVTASEGTLTVRPTPVPAGPNLT